MAEISHIDAETGEPTAYATKVLAHMVLDPDAWWAHAQAVEKIDEEQALTDKVERWKSTYEASLLTEGEDYKDRVAQDRAAKLDLEAQR